MNKPPHPKEYCAPDLFAAWLAGLRRAHVRAQRELARLSASS